MRWLDKFRLSTELTGSPECCMHIGNGESGIFEFFCLTQEQETHLLPERHPRDVVADNVLLNPVEKDLNTLAGHAPSRWITTGSPA
jgi:hypothetical protein